MSLSAGDRLGPYEVTGELGAGGMGIVLRARDTKLDRDVALKVLPEAFTSDPDRLARFEREAKVLASLNHPNIGSIYGLEEAPSTRASSTVGDDDRSQGSGPSDSAHGRQGAVKALVLELVEGPTLADRIKQGPIPLDEALPIAKQIAEALEAAHEQGVIHRDLKPANVKVKDDGTVKVLDFGLAKAFQPDASDPNMSMSPTISLTAAATQMGMIIGTAAYMSPEQARGKVVDKRTDIWAFGVVLYEMLSGARPFQGEDVSLTLASVMKSDVNVTKLPGDVPAAIRTVLDRCLEKDPRNRIRDIGDVSLAMAGAFETRVSTPSASTVVSPLRIWQRPVPAFVVGLTLLGLGGLGVWQLTRPAPVVPIRMPIQVEDLAVNTHGAGSVIALSPDGSRLAYVSGEGDTGQLYVRRLDAFDATPIAGADDAYSPFFSPNGEWIGFATGGGELKKVRLAAGAPEVITTLDGEMHGATWGPDDRIVFAGRGSQRGLSLVSALGGPSETILQPDTGSGNLGWPSFLPDGKAVLFTAGGGTGVSVLLPDTGVVHPLFETGGNAHYLATGHLVHAEGGRLWATPFDADQGQLTGEPVAVLDGLAMGLPRETFIAHYDVSANGMLAYLPGEAPDGVGGTRSLVWVNHDGEEEPVATRVASYNSLSLSPDGSRAALAVVDGSGNPDVWVSDLARGSLVPLTTDAATDISPLWHPDGRRVAFVSDRSGQLEVLWREVGGSETAERLLVFDEAVSRIALHDWSADGATLFLGAVLPESDSDVGMVSVGERPGSWEPLIQTAARELSPALSPDGRWLAYSSDLSGVYEVYVVRFPGLDGQEPISIGGGDLPTWSDDGRVLFYLRRPAGPPDAVMRVPLDFIEGEPPTVIAGTPERLFDFGRYFSIRGSERVYDISPDGQRFLMITAADAADAELDRSRINVIFDWFEELNARVPIP